MASKLSSPYKNNIWKRDPRYDIDCASLSKKEFDIICRLGAVDIAKKQVPPVPSMELLKIYKAIKLLPPAKTATSTDIQNYLDNTINAYGAGIPTLICMLAVESNGDYPPMDSKFAAGFLAKGIITEAEERKLNSKLIANFCPIYVKRIVPAWLKSRKTRTAEQADNYWGRGGKD
jgi:hypothetical protein